MLFLKWAAIFFLVALVAAVFGFSGIAEGAVEISQFLFGIFLVICVILLIIGIYLVKKVT
ncbi:MAG: DUF1328 domain-containing protein [Nitrospirales bacterium]